MKSEPGTYMKLACADLTSDLGIISGLGIVAPGSSPDCIVNYDDKRSILSFVVIVYVLLFWRYPRPTT